MKAGLFIFNHAFPCPHYFMAIKKRLGSASKSKSLAFDAKVASTCNTKCKTKRCLAEHKQKELLLVSLAEEESNGAAQALDHAWHIQSSTCLQLELWSMNKKAKMMQEQKKEFGGAQSK